MGIIKLKTLKKNRLRLAKKKRHVGIKSIKKKILKNVTKKKITIIKNHLLKTISSIKRYRTIKHILN